MYPGFYIYKSILSGSWQPCLPANQKSARFDRLLQAVRPVNGCSCSSFFRQLAACSGDQRRAHQKAFAPEALKLAETCGCGGSNSFLDLPAAGSCERFYNLLTGYSLQNYEQWIIRVLTGNCRNETGKWFHYRLVEQLYALIVMHLPAHDIPTELLLIACRVKAASAILMHRMMTAMPVTENGCHTYIRPRDELKSALAACDLALPARKEVMDLFDSTTASSRLPAPGMQPSKVVLPLPFSTDHLSLPEDHPLYKIENAFKQDSKTIRQMAKKLLDHSARQVNPAGEDTSRRIDSATACRILGISRKKLQRLRNNGDLPYTNFGGKYFYQLEDINNLINDRSNKKKPAPGKEGA